MRQLHRALRAVARTLSLVSTLPWRGEVHLTRYSMYRRLAEVVQDLPEARMPGAKVLAISGSAGLLRRIGLPDGHVVEADYPDHDMLDLRSFPDDQFDIVVSDQVLEHVDGSPQEAIAEAFRVLRPGGLVVHTTCFLNPIHYGPKDLWRFSPAALELMCAPHAPIVSSGSWGNMWMPILLALGLRHTPTPPRWHPLGAIARMNNPTWPFVTWVVARKDAE